MLTDHQITLLIAETIEQVEEVYTAPHIAYKPITWEWAPRFETKMGQAHYALRLVRFNPNLWPHAPEDEQADTVVHEVCHILAFDVYGRPGAGHSPGFYTLMALCGYPEAQRCHSVQGPRNAACDCRDWGLSRMSFRRLHRKPGCYRCPKCKKILIPLTELPVAAHAIWAPSTNQPSGTDMGDALTELDTLLEDYL